MILVLALLLAAPAEAAPVDCATPAVLIAPWAAWRESVPATAGIKASGAPALTLGKAIEASLAPAGSVEFAATPAKGATEGHAGLFTLSLEKPARVGIALSGPAWIDVVDAATPLTSVDHGHGPACSGIRKIVWFDLTAGTHIVQIAGSATPTIQVMAAEQAR